MLGNKVSPLAQCDNLNVTSTNYQQPPKGVPKKLDTLMCNLIEKKQQKNRWLVGGHLYSNEVFLKNMRSEGVNNWPQLILERE